LGNVLNDSDSGTGIEHATWWKIVICARFNVLGISSDSDQIYLDEDTGLGTSNWVKGEEDKSNSPRQQWRNSGTGDSVVLIKDLK
jgi:uncharacterized Zn ribbon protein